MSENCFWWGPEKTDGETPRDGRMISSKNYGEKKIRRDSEKKKM